MRQYSAIPHFAIDLESVQAGLVITSAAEDRGKASEQRPPIARASSATDSTRRKDHWNCSGELDLDPDIIALRSATALYCLTLSSPPYEDSYY